MSLTAKQQRFVKEYLVDLCAIQAAIRAGYSPRTAGRIGHENLKKLEIQTAIHDAAASRSERTAIEADQVLEALAEAAFWDPAELLRFGMPQTPEDLAKLPKSIRRCIVAWHWDKAGRLNIKLADKHRALELLGRHLGLWRERHDHSVPDGRPTPVESPPVRDFSALTNEEIRQYRRILIKLNGTDDADVNLDGTPTVLAPPSRI